MGGAAGRPPGAAGERDAGGQEDGVPPTGKFLVTAHLKTNCTAAMNTRRRHKDHRSIRASNLAQSEIITSGHVWKVFQGFK